MVGYFLEDDFILILIKLTSYTLLYSFPNESSQFYEDFDVNLMYYLLFNLFNNV